MEERNERTRLMIKNIHRPRALLILFAAAILLTGLLALVGANPAWAAEPNFELPQHFPVGTTPTTVTNADFNGDGKMDLAAQNLGTDGVSVLLGKGDGTFEDNTDFTVGDGPTAVISADFNNDGIADLAVSNQNSNNVSVLLGNGDGTFEDKTNHAAGTAPSSVAGADFDGDGDADLAVSNSASNNVSVLLGNGDGTFAAAQPYSVSVGGSTPNQIITDDFNGDGDVDLATANVGGNTPEFPRFWGGVTILFGNGEGTFQDARKVLSVHLDYSVASADFNDDGDRDLVATAFGMTSGCCIDGSVIVALGNGDGTFGSVRTFRVGSGRTGPSAVASADFSRDGRRDLVVSNSATDDVSVMQGNGDGTFGTAQNFAAGDLPAFVISADFNSDDLADLAVANQESNNVSVLLNTPAPQTTITSGPSEGQVTNSTSATFVFSSSESGSTFQCSLDNPNDSAYSPCTSLKAVPDEGILADGEHTFYVKATGAAGSTDPTPATRRWRVDTTAPAAPVITNPPEDSLVSGSFAVSGTAEVGSTVELFEVDPATGARTSTGTPTTAGTGGNWSIPLSGVAEGNHNYVAKTSDAAGNTSAESNSRTVIVDATLPTVTGKSPKPNTTGISPNANVIATFSEAMMQSSLNRTTLKVVRVGTTRAVGASISYPAPNRVVLNPTDSLVRGASYRVTIVGGANGAKDLAGNALAANVSWKFEVRA
jgi:hypothetical protein